MSDSKPEGEASMEDILNSIRKAVEAEEWPEGDEREEVIELTRVVQDDGSVVDLAVEEDPGYWARKASGEAESEDKVVEQDKDTGIPNTETTKESAERPQQGQGDDRISRAAGSAALSSFISKSEARAVDAGPQLGSGRTLEGVVREALVPHVRDWLEENLVPLVQNIVREEIERMVRRRDDDKS